MVNWCCVPNCQGNHVRGPKLRMFRFPAQEDRKNEWLNAISRKDFQPKKNSMVCELHFRSSEIIRKPSCFDEEKEKLLTGRRQRVRVKYNAVPSIFPGPPLYTSSAASAGICDMPSRQKKRPKAKITVPYCAVISCSNNEQNSKRKAIKLHEFPEDSKIRRDWLTKCKHRGKIDIKYARVCSEHFRHEDYKSDLPNEVLGIAYGKFLKYNAVPSLNIPQFETLLLKSEDEIQPQEMNKLIKIEPSEAILSTVPLKTSPVCQKKQNDQTDSVERRVTLFGEVELKCRKVTECEAVDQLSKLCRICGLPSADTVPILEDVDLCSKIIKCLPAVITRTDKMPKQVCGTCISKVNASFELLQMFVEAQSHLKALVGIASEEQSKRTDSSRSLMLQHTQENSKITKSVKDIRHDSHYTSVENKDASHATVSVSENKDISCTQIFKCPLFNEANRTRVLHNSDFKCENCDYTASKEEFLNHHKTICFRVKPPIVQKLSKCTNCGKDYAFEISHEHQQNGKKPKLMCNFCGQVFTSYTANEEINDHVL